MTANPFDEHTRLWADEIAPIRTEVDEEFAAAIFNAALDQGRCAELLTCLWSGGTAAVRFDGALMLIEAKS